MIVIMGMGLKQGVAVTVTAEGDDEMQAIEAMQAFFNQKLTKTFLKMGMDEFR